MLNARISREVDIIKQCWSSRITFWNVETLPTMSTIELLCTSSTKSLYFTQSKVSLLEFFLKYLYVLNKNTCSDCNETPFIFVWINWLQPSFSMQNCFVLMCTTIVERFYHLFETPCTQFITLKISVYRQRKLKIKEIYYWSLLTISLQFLI